MASIAPTAFSLTAGASRVLTFTSVTGTASLDGNSTFGADGGVYPNIPDVNVSGYGGLTGILDNNPNNTGALFAVFTAGTPTGSTSATTNITGTEGNASFSPSLNQVFFVGDGRTGNGSGAVQNFFVPTGATALYLGFVDGGPIQGNGGSSVPPSAYGDNTGSFTATFQVTPAAATPEPSSLWLGALAILPIGMSRFRQRTRKRTAPF